MPCISGVLAGIAALARLTLRPMPDPERYIAVVASTELRPVPFVPEISLHIAENAYDVWEITNSGASDDTQTPVPYWSFPWAGGQALARYILDNPELVRGRRVLDVAAGSGLVAIAAALAGAAVSVANDIDDFAAAAQDLNARANGVVIEMSTADLLDGAAHAGSGSGSGSKRAAYDVVLAGDVCYEREFSGRILGFLHRMAAGGAVVLLGDPGRTYLPTDGIAEVATYDVPTTLALENSETKRTTIWRPVG
ncbi:MAG: class I SAM-dependent methyltransferase [Acidothermaceae bacterium]